MYFSPTAKLAMGSFAQNSFGGIRCSCNTRFQRRFRRVPEGSGACQCRWLMRFWKVPVQKADGFRSVPVQIARLKLLRCPVHIADKVPEGSGTKPSKIFQTVGDSAWVYFYHFKRLCLLTTLDPKTSSRLPGQRPLRRPGAVAQHDGARGLAEAAGLNDQLHSYSETKPKKKHES